jgi:uncharacterized protein YoaH (UPF0181 family)
VQRPHGLNGLQHHQIQGALQYIGFLLAHGLSSSDFYYAEL